MGINQRADSHQTPKGTIDMTSRNTNSKIRRNTALGVTAGVLGGGAIGLMLGVPGATSAATDDNVAVVSALQDSDAEVTDPATDDSVEHPVRVELTRQSLQELVDDGTITSEQADAVAEHLIENRPHLGGHRRHGGGRDGKLRHRDRRRSRNRRRHAARGAAFRDNRSPTSPRPTGSTFRS